METARKLKGWTPMLPNLLKPNKESPVNQQERSNQDAVGWDSVTQREDAATLSRANRNQLLRRIQTQMNDELSNTDEVTVGMKLVQRLDDGSEFFNHSERCTNIPSFQDIYHSFNNCMPEALRDCPVLNDNGLLPIDVLKAKPYYEDLVCRHEVLQSFLPNASDEEELSYETDLSESVSLPDEEPETPPTEPPRDVLEEDPETLDPITDGSNLRSLSASFSISQHASRQASLENITRKLSVSYAVLETEPEEAMTSHSRVTVDPRPTAIDEIPVASGSRRKSINPGKEAVKRHSILVAALPKDESEEEEDDMPIVRRFRNTRKMPGGTSPAAICMDRSILKESQGPKDIDREELKLRMRAEAESQFQQTLTSAGIKKGKLELLLQQEAERKQKLMNRQQEMNGDKIISPSEARKMFMERTSVTPDPPNSVT